MVSGKIQANSPRLYYGRGPFLLDPLFRPCSLAALEEGRAELGTGGEFRTLLNKQVLELPPQEASLIGRNRCPNPGLLSPQKTFAYNSSPGDVNAK